MFLKLINKNYLKRYYKVNLNSFSSFSSLSSLSLKNNYLKHNLKFFSNLIDEYESKDDDEFIFPVQIITNSQVKYYWSGIEITEIFDLSSTQFQSFKKIIYNKRNVKIIKVQHIQEGNITFTLIKDQHKTWKVCNIFKFGLESINQLEKFESPVLNGFLNEINLTTDVSNLDDPYQYISSPYALKLRESISNYIVRPSDKGVFEYFENPKVIFRSKDQILLETNLILKDVNGVTISLIDLLLVIIDFNTSQERIACVIVGGEKLNKR